MTNRNGMETEDRRSSGTSIKTSKKGGKRVKGMTAEEVARRREEVRQRLELEKRAQKVVERLLEDSVSEDFLVDCAKFITPANYKDVIEERSIAKVCGYPICPNKLGKIPTQQYTISTKTNKVYDITERKCFCSNFCYKASKQFELQISKTPFWLRQHESPAEIKLMKKGDSGSSGEEVKLSVRCVQEEDIENPLAALPADPDGSAVAAGLAHSDDEQEQDFVSSLVSQKQVHWGDLPKRTDKEEKGEQMKTVRREEAEDNTEHHLIQDTERNETHACEKKVRTDAKKPKQLHIINSDHVLPEQKDLPEEPSVEEATAKLILCSTSETVTHNTPVDSTATLYTAPLTTQSCLDLNPSTESRAHLDLSPLTLTTTADQNNTTLQNQTDFSITQVGMSRKAAAGLRDLLKKQSLTATPDSIRLNLLKCLKQTLKEWSTNETLRFLYGGDCLLRDPYSDVEDGQKKDEELDEDDLEDEVTMKDRDGVDDRVEKSSSAAAPDYEMLQKETQHLEFMVREFYKGSWILPEKTEESHQNKEKVQDQCMKEPVLPLVDSHAQHLIQKRITVEKLTSCLRNIVGPLHLTMNDISADLNNLVRTFRFTNKNIIHNTPEWTLIAVVLLHLLSEVSPVVRVALETSASVEYLKALMKELRLQEQDLLNLVRLFKTPTR